MKAQPLYFETILDLAKVAEKPLVLHPSFAIFPIEEIKTLPASMAGPMAFNFYTIGLKRNVKDCVAYGMTKYDFDKGVLGFTSPNQIIEINPDLGDDANGWMILLQREFMYAHPLEKKVDEYGYFSYHENEALHMSDKEAKIIDGIFENIFAEYNNNIDSYSQEVVLSYLDLLLSYSNRFYGRQFITRHQSGYRLLDNFNQIIKPYFRDEKYKENGIPSVIYFAEALNVSANYLSDYLKTNTGKSTQEHIHLHLIEKAKAMLLGSSDSISEIAYDLGFEYPQYFSRLFSQKTGVSPKHFRLGES